MYVVVYVQIFLDLENYNGRFDKWKVVCRLLIPAKAAGSVIGKSGSTIKG